MTTTHILEDSARSASQAKKRPWGAYVLTGISALFMTMDASMHLAAPDFVVESCRKLGYPVSVMPALGAVVVALTVLYLVPRTSILGAILLTGYLGGAVSTHVRVGEPFYFPFIIAALIWGGIYFRDERLRALVPFRSNVAR